MFINKLDELIFDYTKLFATKTIETKTILSLQDVHKYNNDMIVKYDELHKYFNTKSCFEKTCVIIGNYNIYFYVLYNGFDSNDFENYLLLLKLDPDINNNIINVRKNIDAKNSSNKFNIIITAIFKELYLKHDKFTILKLIEEDDYESSEYKIIKILVADKILLSYNDFEWALDIMKHDYKHIIENAFELYQKSQKTLVQEIDDKIDRLFVSGLLVPITDEFMRYAKYDEKKIQQNQDIKREDIRVKTIVDKLNQTTNYYTLKDQSLFDQNLLNRKAIAINDDEEILIIQRALNVGHFNMSSIDLYNDLLSFRENIYHDFKDFFKYGFSFKPTSTVTAVRSSNFEFKENKTLPIECRAIGSYIRANIVGIIIAPLQPLYCFTTDQCVKLEDELMISDLLQQKMEKKLDKLYYYYFDKIDCKQVLAQIYNEFENFLTDTFIKTISSHYFDDNFKLLEIINKLILPLNEINIGKILIQMVLNSKTHVFNAIKDPIIKPLPIKRMNKRQKNPILRITNANIVDQNNEFNQMQLTCIHIIKWNELQNIKKEYFIEKLNEFISKYLIVNDILQQYICKSCNEHIAELLIYVQGINDTNSGNIIVKSTINKQELYEKYGQIIEFIILYLERISLALNLTSYMSKENKHRRIDIVMEFLTIYSYLNSIEIVITEKSQSIFGIFDLTQEIQSILYGEENEIITKNDIQNYKFNNIILFILILLLSNMSLAQILLFVVDKYYNYSMYKFRGFKLFEGIKLGDTDVLQYPVLCYCLYIFSGILLKYKLWINIASNNNQSIIINSMIHLIEWIINNPLKDNIQYSNLHNKLKHQLTTLFSDTQILELVDKRNSKYISIEGNTLKVFKQSINLFEITAETFFEDIRINYGTNKHSANLHKMSFDKYKFKTRDFSANYAKYAKDTIDEINRFNDGRQIIKNIHGNDKTHEETKCKSSEKYHDAAMNLEQTYFDKLFEKYFTKDSDNYVIAHDIYGEPTSNTIIFSEKEIMKNSNQYFNQLVYYKTVDAITYYYNSSTLQYLGYKNRDKHQTINKYCFLQTNKSFYNKFRLFGFTDNEYNMTNGNNILYNRFMNIKNMINEIITTILKQRIETIKFDIRFVKMLNGIFYESVDIPNNKKSIEELNEIDDSSKILLNVFSAFLIDVLEKNPNNPIQQTIVKIITNQFDQLFQFSNSNVNNDAINVIAKIIGDNYDIQEFNIDDESDEEDKDENEDDTNEKKREKEDNEEINEGLDVDIDEENPDDIVGNDQYMFMDKDE